MEFEFILENMHRRQIFSVRAYELLFTAEHMYFVHLGEDSSQMPMGQSIGGLAGGIAQGIADSMSKRSMEKKLEVIQREGLDAAVAKDKHSLKAAYKELEAFHSDPRKWNKWPSVIFTVKGKGKHKFTFNPNMENLEEERLSFIEYLRGKRPEVVRGTYA